jgi:hypothetical protein
MRFAAVVLAASAVIGQQITAPPPLPPAPPLPLSCAPYGASNYSTVECFLALEEGYVYRIATDCGSVKGDTVLRLRDPFDLQVGFNDDAPWLCPGGDQSASAIDYAVPVRCSTDKFASAVLTPSAVRPIQRARHPRLRARPGLLRRDLLRGGGEGHLLSGTCPPRRQRCFTLL